MQSMLLDCMMIAQIVGHFLSYTHQGRPPDASTDFKQIFLQLLSDVGDPREPCVTFKRANW